MRLATRLGIGLVLGGILAPATCLAHELFVVCQDDASLIRIDTRRETVTARIGVAPGPAMIAATRDGRTLFVTHPESGRITKLDALDLGAPQILTPGGTPFGIVVDPVGRFVYVGDWKKNVGRKLDAGTGAILQETPVGREPAGLALDAQRARLYVANRESRSVSVIETGPMRAFTEIGVGKGTVAHSDFCESAHRPGFDDADGTALAVRDI